MAEYIDRDAAMLTPILPKEYRQYQTENLDDAYEEGWLDALAILKMLPPLTLSRGTDAVAGAAEGRENGR